MFCCFCGRKVGTVTIKKWSPFRDLTWLFHFFVAVSVPSAVPSACEPETNKTNGHNPAPRLSISSPRTAVIASMETPSQGLQTVMKWKTVVAIFFVVVAYLVTGGLVFRALEQPEESSQKNRIANDKEEFLNVHNCVSPQELEALIKVRGVRWGTVRKWFRGFPERSVGLPLSLETIAGLIYWCVSPPFNI